MRLATLIAFLHFVFVTGIEASESERLGFNFEAGSRTSVGVTFRVQNRLSLRPALAFLELKADNPPVYIEPGEDFPIYKTTERVIQVGLGLVYYVSSDDRDARPYIGLDVFLGHQNQPFQTLDEGVIVYRNGSLRQISSRGFFGVELSITRRLSAYGEFGLEYSKRERFTFGGKILNSRYMGSFSSGVGIIIYVW